MTDDIAAQLPRTLHKLKVEVSGLPVSIWRSVEVDGNITLDRFHEILQIVMGWDNRHLHAFSNQSNVAVGARTAKPKLLWLTEEPLDDGITGTPENSVTLTEALSACDGVLWYAYDFGDGWEHQVTSLGSREAAESGPAARILAGERSAPPEDSGGPLEFTHLLDVLAGPDSSQRDALLRWLQTTRTAWNPYRPHDYDVESRNRMLALACRLQGIGTTSPFDPSASKPNRLGGFLFTGERDGRPDEVRLFLTAQLAAAGVDPLAHPAPVAAPRAVEAMVSRYRWIITAALEGGIKLTDAGWMSPAVVKKAYAALDFGRKLHPWEPVGSESRSPEISSLRTSAVETGLLKEEGQKLVATATGKRLVNSPQKLFSHLASRAVEPGLKGSAFDTTLLILMASALGPDHGPDIRNGQATIQGLNWLGYRNQDHSEITDLWLADSSERLSDIKNQLGIGFMGDFGRGQAAIDFARAVLLS